LKINSSFRNKHFATTFNQIIKSFQSTKKNSWIQKWNISKLPIKYNKFPTFCSLHLFKFTNIEYVKLKKMMKKYSKLRWDKIVKELGELRRYFSYIQLWRNVLKSSKILSQKYNYTNCTRASTETISSWLKNESELLRETIISMIYKDKKINWKKVSQFVKGRKPSQCHKHWVQNLDPHLNSLRWSHLEDNNLLKIVARVANSPYCTRMSWKYVSKKIGNNRRALTCMYRYIRLMKKQHKYMLLHQPNIKRYQLMSTTTHFCSVNIQHNITMDLKLHPNCFVIFKMYYNVSHVPVRCGNNKIPRFEFLLNGIENSNLYGAFTENYETFNIFYCLVMDNVLLLPCLKLVEINKSLQRKNSLQINYRKRFTYQMKDIMLYFLRKKN